MLKQKARVVAQIVFGVDLVLTSVAFFAAFFIRDLLLPVIDPVHFPTGLFPLAEYLKLSPERAAAIEGALGSLGSIFGMLIAVLIVLAASVGPLAAAVIGIKALQRRARRETVEA